MTKKKSTSKSKEQKPAPASAADIKPFGSTFILKDKNLIPELELPDEGEYYPLPHLSQENLSDLVVANRETLFGKHIIGLSVKEKGDPLPYTALLFDIRNPNKPLIYLLALATELTPAMLSLMALNQYLSDKANRETLREELIAAVRKDKRFAKLVGGFISAEGMIISVLETAVRKGLRGLLFFNTADDLTDSGIVTSYMGAHGGQIDVVYLRLYKVGKQTVLSMVPSFGQLKAEAPKPPKEKVIHTEEDHLAKASELARTIYLKLKAEALELDKSLVVNPKGKHYISLRREGSRNLAFFHFRRNSIYLVVMLPESQVKKLVKKSEIKSLPTSVQSFWNGASTGLVISSAEHLKEIAEVFRKLVKQ